MEDKIHTTSCSGTAKIDNYLEQILRLQHYASSPYEQFRAGISITEIKCKENLTLLKKTSNELPICVSIKTGQKLLERKFAQTIAVTGPLESMQKSDSYQREITILSISPKNITLPEPKNQTQKMYKLPGGGYFIPEENEN